MQKIKLTVGGMSCSHCVKAVETAVSAIDGVADISVDLAQKTAEVSYDADKTNADAIKLAITGQGFDVLD